MLESQDHKRELKKKNFNEYCCFSYPVVRVFQNETISYWFREKNNSNKLFVLNKFFRKHFI